MATDIEIGLRSWPKGRDLIKRTLDAALEGALEQISKEAASDASELNNLRFRAKRFDVLQTENDTLKSELAEALEKLRDTHTLNPDIEPSNRPQITPKPTGERLPTLSPAQEDGGTQKVDRAIYQHLVLKFNSLYENQKDLIKARQILEDKYRKTKDLRTGWENYSNGQHHYIKKLLAQLRENGITPMPRPNNLKSPGGAPRRLAADVEVPATSSRGSKEQSPPKALARITTALIPSSDGIAPAGENDHDDEPSLPKLLPAVLEGSSTKSDEPVLSSTQGDVDEEQHSVEVFIKSESPDSPVIVSCRSVKRKRDVRQSRDEDIKPKVENSSSPTGLRGLYNLNESIDLDDVGQHIDTPRKKRQQILDEMLLNAPNQPMIQPVSFDSSRNTQTRDGLDSQRHRGVSAPAVETPQPKRRSTALQTLSTNKTVTPRTSDARVPKKRRMEDKVSGAYLLAEDGENEDSAVSAPEPNTTTPKPARRSRLEQSELNQRLSGLLEQPSPKPNVLIRNASPRTPRVISPQKGKSRLNLDSPTIAQKLQVSAGREPASENNAKVRRTMEIEEDRPGPSKPTTRKSTRIPGEPAQDLANDPDNKPYRERPLDELSLKHFKVNPNYNQGYEYAFSDVVRKKDERMCLSGCTDPTCCGDKFRKLAEIQLEDRRSRQATKADEEEEKRLLRDYLGSGYERIRSMSNDERRETLLEAMTRELANKHGRHRHAYERRKSPPGFWRADFPTTQEEEQDREAARLVEREKIKERYMAAMRGNGPWLFRDE